MWVGNAPPAMLIRPGTGVIRGFRSTITGLAETAVPATLEAMRTLRTARLVTMRMVKADMMIKAIGGS